ncbi:hypothetical protein LJR225_005161 [Phenylobacterium sp. LjRoot225]|uniref:hypothetical protein n=1 Tax=Phenylobacterium sp. LjRoot225 TaxID=3342285 RepID=UPI003ECFDA70
MMAADPRDARRAIARLVREIDEAASLRHADDEEFQEAAAQGRDLMVNAASLFEAVQHIERLTLRFIGNPTSEPEPALLINDIFLVTRIALDSIEDVIEQ